MRIIYCVPYFLPSEGGLERAVFYLAKQMVLLGHRVKVFTFNSVSSSRDIIRPICSSGLMSYEVIDDVEVHRFDYSCLAPMGFKFSLPLALKLLKEKPDIIHLHAVISFPNMLLIGLCGRIMHVPVILTAHGMHEVSSILSSHKFGAIGTSVLKLGLANVNKFIVLSDFSRKALTKLGVKSKDIVYIPSGVDFSRFGSHEFIKGILKKYEITGSRVALCVARIARNKGLHNLILAASDVSKEFDDVTFLVVGPTWDATYKQDLDDLIRRFNLSGKVVFLGEIPDDDLTGLYKLADVFILPSEDETLPLVILEAMAAGCPIIATRVGGVPQVIDNRKNGILVAPGDPKELARWTITLLYDEDLRHAISRRAYETAKQYSWTKIAKKTVEVYFQSLNVFCK